MHAEETATCYPCILTARSYVKWETLDIFQIYNKEASRASVLRVPQL